MNQAFLEERSKEKINDLLNEGIRSQEYHRNRKPNLFLSIVKGCVAMLGMIFNFLFLREKRYLSSYQRS